MSTPAAEGLPAPGTLRRRLRIRPRTVVVHVVAWAIGLAWALPFFGVAMVAFRPLSQTSLGWWHLSPFTVTFENFIAAWNNQGCPLSLGLRDSFLVALPATIIPMFIGALAGYGFARFHTATRDYIFLAVLLQNIRGASVVKSLVFLGMVTPLIVIGVVLRFILEAPIGLIPAFFGWLGVRSLAGNWLVTPSTLLLGLIFGTVWSWTGFSMIVYSAGLTTIPKDYFEAARVDGATEWQAFRKITWPLLRPITLVIVTMTVLWELKLFDIVIGATAGSQQGGVGGAADVLALQMYRYFFIIDYNRAAVVATLLTIFTLIVAVVLFRRLLTAPRRKKRRRLTPSVRRMEARRVGPEEAGGSEVVT